MAQVLGILGVLGFLALLAFAVVQFAAGFAGIEFHLGAGWAWAALLAAFILRFTLPITIGSFFGAMDVWGWHWGLALIFAMPGLLLMIPGIFVAIIGMVRK